MATYLVRRDLPALLESERRRDPHGRVPALALVEIDRFSELRDLHGRAIGDHVMQQLAELVRGHAHELDVVERFYDDLIVIVLHQPVEGCSAETIRAAVEAHGFEPGGLRVTVSIGFPSGEANSLDDARANLRRAKLLGGNRVVSGDSDATHHQVDPWPDEALHFSRRRAN